MFFDNDRLRDQAAQSIAYLRRLETGCSALSYHSSRTRLWIRILAEARDGTLSPTWREELASDVAKPVETTAAVRGQILGVLPLFAFDADSDIDALVVHELVTMPLRPWEPYAARGDWRAALDAWYADTLAVNEYRRQPVDPLLSEHVGIAGSRIAPGIDDMLTTFWEASYRAGLAAGGEDGSGDWQAWLNTQMEAHQSVANLPLTGRPADPEGLRQHLQQLPRYWADEHL